MLKFTCFPAGRRVADGERRPSRIPFCYFRLANHSLTSSIPLRITPLRVDCISDARLSNSDISSWDILMRTEESFKLSPMNGRPIPLSLGDNRFTSLSRNSITNVATKVNHICNNSEICRNVAVILARLKSQGGAGINPRGGKGPQPLTLQIRSRRHVRRDGM